MLLVSRYGSLKLSYVSFEDFLPELLLSLTFRQIPVLPQITLRVIYCGTAIFGRDQVRHSIS